MRKFQLLSISSKTKSGDRFKLIEDLQILKLNHSEETAKSEELVVLEDHHQISLQEDRVLIIKKHPQLEEDHQLGTTAHQQDPQREVTLPRHMMSQQGQIHHLRDILYQE